MCLQFVSHRISSAPSNSYKQTAHLSGGFGRSENFTTGRSSRRSRADGGGLRGNWSSGGRLSEGRNSGRPRRRKRERMRNLRTSRRERRWRNMVGKKTSVQPTGKPITEV
uniref:Uncharacterized protein n=1 Tax=Cucumis sativus TaxID=3659 RepID=A0A0A0KA13_CUCSA